MNFPQIVYFLGARRDIASFAEQHNWAPEQACNVYEVAGGAPKSRLSQSSRQASLKQACKPLIYNGSMSCTMPLKVSGLDSLLYFTHFCLSFCALGSGKKGFYPKIILLRPGRGFYLLTVYKFKRNDSLLDLKTFCLILILYESSASKDALARSGQYRW